MDPNAGISYAAMQAKTREYKRQLRKQRKARTRQNRQLRRYHGKIQKGKPWGRVLFFKQVGNRELYYHATKGWRSRAK